MLEGELMTSAATADSLVAAHDARLQALMAQDTVALAQVVGQDMRFTGPDGNTITRAEVVAAIHAGKLIIEKMDCYDIDLRLYGELGVLWYSADARTSDGETTFEGKVRCTTVYAWRDGSWEMITQHQSRLGG